MDAERALPSAPAYEKLILGSILLDSSVLPLVVNSLSVDDFTSEPNRRVYSSILRLYNSGVSPDRVILCQELYQQGQLDSAGGMAYISSLEEIPRLENLEIYIGTIKEKTRLRRAIFLAQRVIEFALDESPSGDIVPKFKQDLEALTRAGSTPMPEPLAAYIEERGAQRILNPGDRDPALALGFPSIDAMLNGGLRQSEIMILGARPSAGKTALLLNALENVAKSGKPAAMFSAEMSKGALITRLLCKRARIGKKRLMSGDVSEEERQRLQQALSEIYELPLFIDDTSGLQVREIISRVDAMKVKPALVGIDYFQLLRSSIRGNSDERFTQVCNDLQVFSKETGIPLIVLSQLSRDSSKRVTGKKDYRPNLEDFRNSGTIEQIANIGAFLFREEMYDKEREDVKGVAEFIIRKNRDGETGTAMLRFVGWRFEFIDQLENNA